MTCELMKSTQISVALALVTIVKSDNQARFVTLPIISLTPVIFFLWSLGQYVTRQWWEVSELAAALLDLSQALVMAAMPFCYAGVILGKSLAFGMGVRL